MKKGLKFFLITIILSPFFWYGINLFQENLENFFYAQISQPLQEMTFVTKPKKPKLEIEVKSAISLKITKTGKEKILFTKNPEEVLPIASLTKLMTALIVLEDPENYNFSKILTISKTAAAQENVPEYGNLKAGEKKSTEELLNLMLINSSNDAAWALAEVTGIEDFVDKMNRKAKILGLDNTHFVNPTGLDPENLSFSQESKIFFNYSTTQDLLNLSQYILNEFPLIYEISLRQSDYPTKNGFSDLSLNQNIVGGKTGYTKEAGGCMILVLENENGTHFINIILGAESSEARIREMQKLIDWLNI